MGEKQISYKVGGSSFEHYEISEESFYGSVAWVVYRAGLVAGLFSSQLDAFTYVEAAEAWKDML
tara:strand:+ start:450 stop:641 length:192 start_codon:yes stop_codon:yes gene_type:complete